MQASGIQLDGSTTIGRRQPTTIGVHGSSVTRASGGRTPSCAAQRTSSSRGRLQSAGSARVIRDSAVVYEGELSSLRRFKDDVKEVVVGQDCGLNIESFNDIRVGDIVEGYEQVEVKRK